MKIQADGRLSFISAWCHLILSPLCIYSWIKPDAVPTTWPLTSIQTDATHEEYVIDAKMGHACVNAMRVKVDSLYVMSTVVYIHHKHYSLFLTCTRSIMEYTLCLLPLSLCFCSYASGFFFFFFTGLVSIFNIELKASLCQTIVKILYQCFCSKSVFTNCFCAE